MTTVNEWISADNRRRAPEFDFGTGWTSEHDPHTDWAVTYNTGTGEFYARTRNGDDVEVLGQFADPQDVADAMPDWGRRSNQAGSLDWVRRQIRAYEPPAPDVDHADPVYGIVINTDGTTVALREPQSIDDVAGRLGSDLDVATVNTGDRTDRVIMWVDDHGHDKHLTVNAAATQLYGTGWPILGDAIIVSDDNRPLPPTLTHDLLPDVEPGTAALEWDDHLLDRERDDRSLGLDDDIADIDAADLQRMNHNVPEPDGMSQGPSGGDAWPPTLTVDQEQSLIDRLNLLPPDRSMTPTDIAGEIDAWGVEQNDPGVDAWYMASYAHYEPALDVDAGHDIVDGDMDLDP